MTEPLEEYQNIAEKNIQNHIKQLSDRLDNYLPKKLFLGFENDFEFIRGWVMGQIQENLMNLFRETFAKNPDNKEYYKIIQLIMKYNNDIQKEVKTYCKQEI